MRTHLLCRVLQVIEDMESRQGWPDLALTSCFRIRSSDPASDTTQVSQRKKTSRTRSEIWKRAFPENHRKPDPLVVGF